MGVEAVGCVCHRAGDFVGLEVGNAYQGGVWWKTYWS